jgi:hypothetical protein
MKDKKDQIKAQSGFKGARKRTKTPDNFLVTVE